MSASPISGLTRFLVLTVVTGLFLTSLVVFAFILPVPNSQAAVLAASLGEASVLAVMADSAAGMADPAGAPAADAPVVPAEVAPAIEILPLATVSTGAAASSATVAPVAAQDLTAVPVGSSPAFISSLIEEVDCQNGTLQHERVGLGFMPVYEQFCFVPVAWIRADHAMGPNRESYAIREQSTYRLTNLAATADRLAFDDRAGVLTDAAHPMSDYIRVRVIAGGSAPAQVSYQVHLVLDVTTGGHTVSTPLDVNLTFSVVGVSDAE